MQFELEIIGNYYFVVNGKVFSEKLLHFFAPLFITFCTILATNVYSIMVAAIQFTKRFSAHKNIEETVEEG